MARMEIQTPSADGTTERNNRTEAGSALVWANNGEHKYRNTGVEYLRITKGAAAATMTIQTHAPDVYGLALPDKEVAIAANSTKMYGPFSPEAHNERPGATDAGYTGIAFDTIVGLEVTVVKPGEQMR